MANDQEKWLRYRAQRDKQMARMPREQITSRHEAARPSVQRVDGRHPAAGHILAALKEAEELSNAYGLHGSAAMLTLKHLLELSIEQLGDRLDEAKPNSDAK